MRKIAALFVIGLAAASAPAFAGSSVDQRDPNERICRRPPPDTSTRVPSRPVCRTRAEWAEEARTSQQSMRQRGTSGDSFRNPSNPAVNGGN